MVQTLEEAAPRASAGEGCKDGRKLHVCFVCSELPPAPAGGIGPCVLTVARELAGMGHSVSVIGCYDRDYGWHEPGIRVEPIILSENRLIGPIRLPSFILIRSKLARVHRERPIDIVEWPDSQGQFMWNLPGTIDVVRNHGPTMSHRLLGLAPRLRFTEYRELRTLRKIPNWIGVSKWFMGEWIRISGANPRRTIVAYNPVDCDLFHPGPDSERDPNLILYAGRLWERKGAFALARAARLFLRELPDARLLYVGRDPDGRSRETVMAEAGPEVAGRIEFADPLPQPELAALMRRCAVFAMPSLLESFGNVWAEAMASGTPVVGSTLTVGPEIVPDGDAGLLADPNRPEDVARAVVTLMRDPELRRRLGARGREIAVERYSVKTIVPATVAFYRDCIRDEQTEVQPSFRQHAGEPAYSADEQVILGEIYLHERDLREQILMSEPGSPHRQELTRILYERTLQLMARIDRFARAEVATDDLPDRWKSAQSLIRLCRPARVLEIGAGNGALCRSLALAGVPEVHGIDVVKGNQWESIKRETSGAASFQVADATAATLEESSYDLCIMDNVLEHLPPGDYEAALSRAHALLRPGGWLVVVFPNALTGPHDCSRFFVPKGARAQGSHFNERRLSDLKREMQKAGFGRFRSTIVSGLNAGRFALGWSKLHCVSGMLVEAVCGRAPGSRCGSLARFVPSVLAGQKLRAVRSPSPKDRPADVADIALLIPVYNRQELLDRTLASLTEDIPLDVVVVDDGSDPPISVKPGTTDKPVTVIRLEENAGIAGALTAGLRHILDKGYEFIARLDAGDVPVEGRFGKQLAFLREHENHALVGTLATYRQGPSGIDDLGAIPTESRALKRRIHLRNCFAHPCVMYRASAVRAVGMYGPYPSVEDYEYWLRFARHFEVANLPEVLTHLDRDPESLSIKNRKRDERYMMLMQLKHFDPWLPESYIGLARSFLLWITPIGVTALLGSARRRILARGRRKAGG